MPRMNNRTRTATILAAATLAVLAWMTVPAIIEWVAGRPVLVVIVGVLLAVGFIVYGPGTPTETTSARRRHPTSRTS